MDTEKLKEIEEKWQERWEEAGIFEADPEKDKEKFFLAHAYPYPSGPTHHGHARAYLFDDAIVRYKRMQGFNVLYPMGWHCTGNPAMIKAEKVRKGDEETIQSLKDSGVPEDKIEKLKDAQKWVDFFATESDLSYKSCLQTVGCSIDWRREFMTTDETYKKFIQWQYSRLKELGYVIQKEYPVIWCPEQEMPLGDNDVEDESMGAEPEKYVSYKFKMDFNDEEIILPAATLRPETIYGVTNMFLNPEVDYFLAEVEDEKWLLSDKALEKMKYQRENIEEVKDVDPERLIGEHCKNSVTGDEVIILPANFVKSGAATGVVMSVPSHAPYDHIAIEDLKKDEETLGKYDISKEELDFDYISLIDLEDYSDHPAVDISEEMEIKSLDEGEKLEKATEEVYKKEFHQGKLKENTEYPGKQVQAVKEKITEDMVARGAADIFYDTSKRVICKCGATGLVKMVDDQWFLKYSDEKWKEKALELVSRAEVIPEKYREELEHYVGEWMGDKPCARKKTLGTELPFDEKWMVEPLSDSTIYMTYYTIAKTINERGIKGENLDDEIFDYVFWGKGNPEEVAENSGLDAKAVGEMREEFIYWYPLDMRVAGTEHLSNHLSFMIFQHSALFDEELWPKGITIHGMVLDENGNKVSASKGNGYNMREIAQGGMVDALRLGMYVKSSPWDDIKFGKKEVDRTLENLKKKFDRLFKFTEKIEDLEEQEEETHMDKWITSRAQKHLQNTTEAMEDLEIMEAVNEAFYSMMNDFKRYIHSNKISRRTAERNFKTWVKILAPFAPHICEELWEEMGKDGFVSVAEWPEVEEDKIDEEAEAAVELLDSTKKDVKEIEEITGIDDPDEIKIIVAAPWKYKLYEKAVEGKELSEIMEDEEIRSKGDEAASYFQELNKEHELEEIRLNHEGEEEALNEIKEGLSEKFGAEVTVEGEDESDEEKAGKARPEKPAIVLEE